MASQDGTCFGLQNGDAFDGAHVGFVFVAFFWRERSFRVLVSEFLEARLYTRVSTDIDELLGHLWGEQRPRGSRKRVSTAVCWLGI